MNQKKIQEGKTQRADKDVKMPPKYRSKDGKKHGQ